MLRDGVRLGAGEDVGVLAQVKPVATPAGSAVFWDWRIPHSSSMHHVGEAPREAIYTGFLPPTSLNERYANEQWRAYQARQLPPDFSGSKVLPAQLLEPIIPPASDGTPANVLERMVDPQLARQLVAAEALLSSNHDEL